MRLLIAFIFISIFLVLVLVLFRNASFNDSFVHNSLHLRFLFVLRAGVLE
jgi:hypothetical protein